MLVLLGCGAIEVALRRVRSGAGVTGVDAWLLLAAAGATSGGLLALAWVAFKVGALSYGGGFVIIPLMQHDAVDSYHWMTDAQFLNAVALGQVTPGPVVQTVAVVGYAAAGIGGGLLAPARRSARRAGADRRARCTHHETASVLLAPAHAINWTCWSSGSASARWSSWLQLSPPA